MPLQAGVVKDLLVKYQGNMAACARACGVERQTMFAFVQRRETLRTLVQQLRETRVDTAESGLDLAIANREPWAIALVLKTLGRDRGYVEKAAEPPGGAAAVALLAAFERLAAGAAEPEDEVGLRITRVLDAANGPTPPPDAAG